MSNNAACDNKRPKTANNTQVYVTILKTILWIYIILCIVIAGINYGYAPKAPQSVAKVIMWIWLIYENWVKTLFIIICSYLTIKITDRSQKSTMLRRNLKGFIIAALIVHVIAPVITGNYDLYFYSMPLPWTTTPMQLLYSKSQLYQNSLLNWGHRGIIGALIFYVIVCIIVLVGTLFFGRRFQCSTICLFNGFAAEVFEPAIPLIGNKRKPKIGTLKVLNILRWIFLGISLFFVVYWCLILIGVTLPGDITFVTKVASYKYLCGELLMAIFFWIAFTGRGYCYYCPLGTILGLISKLSNQRIVTSKSKCVKCGKCNQVCPMSIDIKNCAAVTADVRDMNCVGCGHCVDTCPTHTLMYSTRFIEYMNSKEEQQNDNNL
ncbi:MAG: putative electron transport protein YccM [Firmicutes bacterium ADurb.Bin419]|nr:MAG: putative electron transport protein YccM [Firmicutes bacterium ADurb.Bin419]